MIIDCLGHECDIEALRKTNILKPEEMEIFERNLKLMKLDEIMNHPSEIEWYETCLAREVEPSKEKFKALIKELELWNIYRKITEWYLAFQPKVEQIQQSPYPYTFNDIFA